MHLPHQVNLGSLHGAKAQTQPATLPITGHVAADGPLECSGSAYQRFDRAIACATQRLARMSVGSTSVMGRPLT